MESKTIVYTEKQYNVFTRTWWKINPRYPSGLEPSAGKKHYTAKGVTWAEARQLCKDYNDSHAPGKLSRKAEFEAV